MIPFIKRILFATDLSENSRHAFLYAASLASSYGAEIVILHVMEEPPSNLENTLSTLIGEEKWRKMKDNIRTRASSVLIGKRNDHEMVHQALEILSSSTRAHLDSRAYELHEIIILPGKVVDQIVRTCRDKACDLIVIGAHPGLFGVRAQGSTAKGVLNRTVTPVLVVPPPPKE